MGVQRESNHTVLAPPFSEPILASRELGLEVLGVCEFVELFGILQEELARPPLRP